MRGKRTKNSADVGGDLSGTLLQVGRDLRVVIGNPWAGLTALVAVVALGVALVLLAVRDEPGTATTAPPGVGPGTRWAVTTTTTETATTEEITTRTTTTGTTAPPTIPLPTTRVPAFEHVHTDEWDLRNVDVDADPPRRGGSASMWLDYLPGVGDGPTLAELYAGSAMAPRGSIAEWTGARAPGPEDCHDQAERLGGPRISLAEGRSYCLVGQDERVVLIQDVRFTDRTVIARLTVWALR